MESYTKSDQYYADEYDRETIEKMKELEKQIPESAEKAMEVIKHRLRYDNYGAERANAREEFIQEQKMSDQRKDLLLANTPAPKNIKCHTCNKEMQVETHIFGVDNRLIFYYSCNVGHLPKRAIYADSSERFIKVRICPDCGGGFESEKKQTKTKLILTDTCKVCGKKEIQDFELPEDPLPINEAEREKYCVSFKGSRTLQQDMQAILDVADLIKEKEEKYDYSHVKQINIAQLEKRLSEAVEKVDFVKFQFEKPKSERWLTVEFSVHDFSSRDQKNSVRALKKVLKESLFPTNWRLMSSDIFYNLGFLTGKIKGFSLEEDLMKIGKEIDSGIK